MTMLFTVYDPAGEPFEVTPAKAKELVIEHGWSMEEPKAKAEPAPEPHVEPAPEPVEAHVEPEPVPAPHVEPAPMGEAAPAP